MGVPRRCNVETMTAGEAAIREAMLAVEMMGSHPWLTDVVVMLSEARDRLADWVDATEEERVEVARVRV